MKKYTYSELNQMRVSKGELFSGLQGSFDYALPQDWLNRFADFCAKENPVITYDLIRSTTVWIYSSLMGEAYTACIEVDSMLDQFYNKGAR